MARASRRVTGGQVRLEGGAELLADGEAPSAVEPLDDPERVGHQVAVDHVGDLVVRDVARVALCGDVVHLHLEPHGHELHQDGVVHVVRVHVVQSRHQVGE